jgi:class 3 adenylate cyclase
MTVPNLDELTQAYFNAQTQRTLGTLERIAGRAPPAAGRLIPGPDDLPISDGRRIEATVMFLDICKFTQRPSETDEEQHVLLQVLALFFSEMIRIVEDHGGVVEKNTGDGLMAYFADNAAAKSEKRAVAAALTMFAAASHLINPILEKSGIPVLNFRICMDRGFITVAKIGAARRFSGLVAVGTTANMASKMLSIAEANTILIGQKMLGGLPADWLVFTVPHPLDTGWYYRANGVAYRYWTYTGRWNIPT